MRNILKIALFYKLFGHIEKIFKKLLTLTLYFAILVHIVFEKTMKNQIHIVFGFAINNGRGAKAISNAKQIKGRLPVL